MLKFKIEAYAIPKDLLPFFVYRDFAILTNSKEEYWYGILDGETPQDAIVYHSDDLPQLLNTIKSYNLKI